MVAGSAAKRPAEVVEVTGKINEIKAWEQRSPTKKPLLKTRASLLQSNQLAVASSSSYILVLAFIVPSDDFILRLLRIAFLSLLLMPDVLFILPLVLVVWSVVEVVVPALGMLEGVPVWAPGAVPGATVWAKAALVVRARAAAKMRVDFMTGERLVRKSSDLAAAISYT
jgi:hypothetical protein